MGSLFARVRLIATVSLAMACMAPTPALAATPASASGTAGNAAPMAYPWTAGAAFDCKNPYMHLRISGDFAGTVYLDWTPTDWSSPYVRTLKIHNSPAMQPERADIDLSKGAWGMRTENPWGVPNEDVGIASVYTSCEMFT